MLVQRTIPTGRQFFGKINRITHGGDKHRADLARSVCANVRAGNNLATEKEIDLVDQLLDEVYGDIDNLSPSFIVDGVLFVRCTKCPSYQPQVRYHLDSKNHRFDPWCPMCKKISGLENKLTKEVKLTTVFLEDDGIEKEFVTDKRSK